MFLLHMRLAGNDLGGRYLFTAAYVKNGHEEKKLFLMALNQVVLTGKRAAACKYKIALLVVDNLNTLCILGCCLAHGGLGVGKIGIV